MTRATMCRRIVVLYRIRPRMEEGPRLPVQVGLQLALAI